MSGLRLFRNVKGRPTKPLFDLQEEIIASERHPLSASLLDQRKEGKERTKSWIPFPPVIQATSFWPLCYVAHVRGIHQPQQQALMNAQQSPRLRILPVR
ncbi:hypothetical protein TNIN_104821 [Trichonephila inaurata madagascariensis]|uniref:Uncharacterized protein n=1 Tax=Trichonephila inaurata madagascariensis TaxID=2747483 RepID=A0A8X6X7K1_9ARAC|nr:hypothetical protein TNIN_104821 [Trichonephila inaurata madagascariensis]